MQTAVAPARLQEAQIETAGLMLGRAFWDDPFSIYLLPDEEQRARALSFLFTAATRYGNLFGEVYATAPPLDGAAVWIPPGSAGMSPERARAAKMDELAAVLGDAAMARFEALLGHMRDLHQRDVPPAHWYLMVLGVEPERQRQGIGSSLIRPVLARADAAGTPCYLETTRESNLAFYRKHGFEVVVEDVFDGLRYWTMRRACAE
jgi:ribosomal protein S18 acetylase RimI-like enzyme